MDLGSPVCCLSLRPKSRRNDLASGPMGPRVSTATGMNAIINIIIRIIMILHCSVLYPIIMYDCLEVAEIFFLFRLS